MALDTNLVSYWKFDEASGTRYDSVGGFNLLEEDAVSAIAGKLNNGVRAENSHALYVPATGALVLTGSFSFSFWTKVYPGQVSSIIAEDKVGSRCLNILSNANDTISLQINDSDAVNSVVAISTTNYDHIVCTYDYVGNGTSIMKIYVNGVLMQTKSDAVGPVNSSTGNFTVCYREYASSHISYVGWLDELAFWNRSISADEVSQIFNSGRANAYPFTPTPELYGAVSYWKLDEGSGTRYDSIYNNNLTDNNTVGYGTGGNAKIVNSSYYISGNSEYLSVSDGTQKGLDITGPLTFSYWFKRPATSTKIVAGKFDSAGAQQSYQLKINASDDKIWFWLSSDGDDTGRGIWISTATFTETSNWHHLVGVYVPGVSMDVYLDGSPLAGSVAIGSVPASLYNGTAAFSFGQDVQGSTTYADGYIDEAGIWNRALSSTEISTLYASGLGLTYPFTTNILAGLQGYWKLDETTGTRADSSGNNNNLTDNNSVGYGSGADAKLVNSANFVAASSQYLSITDAAQTGLGMQDSSYSASFWVKPAASGTTYIMGQWGSVSGDRAWNIAMVVDGGTPNITLYNNANVTSRQLNTAITTGVWYHFVVVYNYATATASLYKNGAFVGSGSLSANSHDSTAAFTLGAVFDTSGQYCDGYLDEVGVWNRVLSANEIAELYNANKALAYPLTVDLNTSIVSYWKLEETTGDRIDAVVSSGNDLTEVNTVGYAGGIIGNAASFVQANNEYLSITDGDQTGLGALTVFSVSMWVKMTSLPSYAYLFAKATPLGYTPYYLQNSEAQSKFYLGFGSQNDADYGQWYAPNLVAGDLGNWVHIVATVDATSTTGGIIYKNGVAQTMSAKLGTATSIGNSNVPFSIGSNAGEANRSMDGLADEVGFWNRILTPAEVTYLYNSGAPGSAQQYPFSGTPAFHFSPFPSHYNT
jgi:hypothetical protein